MRELETPDLRRQISLLQREVADLKRINMQPPIFLRDLKDINVQHDLECLPNPEDEDRIALLYDRETGEWDASSLDEVIAEQVTDPTTLLDDELVISEQEFGLTPSAGSYYGGYDTGYNEPGAARLAQSTHTHGSPLPRHPQEGYPYTGFGDGSVSMGLHESDLLVAPGAIGVVDEGFYERTYIVSPVGADGWGRAALDMKGLNNGSAQAYFYNDLDVDGAYVGSEGGTAKPFSLTLQGVMEFQRISNDPPDKSTFGDARIYYNKNVGKMQISENGSAYRNFGSGDVAYSNTVVPEESFGLVSFPGVAASSSRSDHTHGTPAPRHPQTGWPYVSLGSPGAILLGRNANEAQPGSIGTQEVLDAAQTIVAERTYMVSPMWTSTTGRATLALVGRTDGTAILDLYNDLDLNNNIGPPDPNNPVSSKPFGVELQGDFTWLPIANTPPLSGSGTKPNAKMYFDSATRKLVLSEDGSAYRPIGGEVGTGSAGTFLVTDSVGTGRRWTGTSELMIDSAGRVGIGTGSPSARLSISEKLRMFDTTPPDTAFPTDAGYFFNTSTVMPSGFITEVSGALLSFAINAPQVGIRNTSLVGGIVRLDTRTANTRFAVLGYATGSTTGVSHFTVSLENGNAFFNGNVGIGVGNPLFKLHVEGETQTTRLHVQTPRPSYAAAQIGTNTYPTEDRMFLTSPAGVNGWGWAVLEMYGTNDGTARAHFYNDIDLNGSYGETGVPSKPFRLTVSGTVEIVGNTTGATPPVSVVPAVSGANARLYYDYTLGKLRLSENGGAYKNIGDVVGIGEAGSVLTTNSIGTATTWHPVSNFFIDAANNRVGIGASAPRERLSVRDGTAGLISTFFGPVGGNSSIAVGSDKEVGRSLQIGHDNTNNYGWLSVWGDAAGSALVIDNGGNVGIGITNPAVKLEVAGVIQTQRFFAQTTRPSLLAAQFGVANTFVANEDRSFITSPSGAAGWGWGVLELFGTNDGTARARFYNDIDLNGNYGETTVPSKPFMLGINGYIEINGNLTGVSPPHGSVVPAVSGANARIYYDYTLGKLRLSENGGAYKNISSDDGGVGSAGTFLVTNSAGTERRWTNSNELKIDSSSRVGIGTSTPFTRLAVTGASGAQGGGAGNGILDVTTGTGSSTDEYLSFGIVNGSYAWIQSIKPGTSYRNLCLNPNGANVGVGTTVPQETLAVRNASAGLVSTFFGPATGNNWITVGYDKTAGNGLRIGYDDTNNFGWIGVEGTSYNTSGVLFSDSGSVGIGGIESSYKLNVVGSIKASQIVATGAGKGSIYSTYWTGASFPNDPVILMNPATSFFRAAQFGITGPDLQYGSGVAVNGHGMPYVVFSTFLSSKVYARFDFFNALLQNGTYSGGSNAGTEEHAQVRIFSGMQTAQSMDYAALQIIGRSTNSDVGLSITNSTFGGMFVVISDGFHCRNSANSAYVKIYALSFTPSSKTTKQNVLSFDTKISRQRIRDLQIWKFDRPPLIGATGQTIGGPTTHLGLMAEEVVSIIPEAVSWEEDRPHSLDYSAITTVLIGAVQEHDSEIEKLKKENEALKARVSVLESAA